jgi:hypothetical protein
MQPKTNNSGKFATPDTQDTRRRQTKQRHNTTNISSEKWHMEYVLLLFWFYLFVGLFIFYIRIMSICTDENL